MTMTLSADHRIVDGVMAAKFMQRLKADSGASRRRVGLTWLSNTINCW